MLGVEVPLDANVKPTSASPSIPKTLFDPLPLPEPDPPFLASIN